LYGDIHFIRLLVFEKINLQKHNHSKTSVTLTHCTIQTNKLLLHLVI
jgi:hypothetical protein